MALKKKIKYLRLSRRILLHSQWIQTSQPKSSTFLRFQSHLSPTIQASRWGCSRPNISVELSQYEETRKSPPVFIKKMSKINGLNSDFILILDSAYLHLKLFNNYYSKLQISQANLFLFQRDRTILSHICTAPFKSNYVAIICYFHHSTPY